MKQFSEFIPLAIFAGIYIFTKDIFLSTGVLMAAMSVQVGYEYIVKRELSGQTKFIFGSVIVLGGMTLIFRDERFIQWKPTLVNWVFCIALLSSQIFAKDNLLKKMLGEQMQLPIHVWRNLALGWSAGFFFAGALNLVIAFNFDMDFWVTYKFIGGFALTFVYMAITMVYLIKGGHISEDTKPASADVNQP